MTTATVTLALVVVVPLAFDFTNGFHDTGNAMATSIATGALRPKLAVALSAVLNLVGAFVSVEVALTVTNAVINIQTSKGAPRPELLADGGSVLLLIILAGLVGGIVWNLLTWLLGLPSSSSHALFGGLIGSAISKPPDDDGRPGPTGPGLPHTRYAGQLTASRASTIPSP